jgi:hypothetical protein
MKVSSENWVAIRRCSDDGHEFMDLNTVSCEREHCTMLAERSTESNPVWAKANPVVRFSVVDINEI